MFALRALGLPSAFLRGETLPFLLRPLIPTATAASPSQSNATPSTNIRNFSSTSRSQDWLLPKAGHTKSRFTGNPRINTGGSTRGTTVVWGDYGMRMTDRHRRFSAKQLKEAEFTIRRCLKGMKFKIYKRICANIPVYTKGNESRMGTGKGSMDFWASRVSVSRIIFELKGELHEKVAREAFRVAWQKLPGTYEFVKRGDYAVMGITKLTPENTKALMERKARFPGQNCLNAFNPLPEEAETGCTRVVKP